MKDLYWGYFIRRINRFVVELHIFEPKGDVLRAYLPNPGRLWELFYQGSRLILEKTSSSNKYPYQIIGVKKGDKSVFLHTLRNNDLAEYLISRQLIPSLKEWRILKREVTHPGERSRFDFLLEKEGEPCYLEVKSCSLFQGKIAMFPDAPSERGTRHLKDLQQLSQEGYQCAVLIIVQDDEAEYFLPEYHTDPDFAEMFQQCREDLKFIVIGSAMEESMGFPGHVSELSIPWEILERENHDSGCYMMLVEIAEPIQIRVGSLGELFFDKGFYVYCGSAKTGLKARTSRHLRKRKNLHWHLDYLRQKASTVKALPVRSSADLECILAKSVQKISSRSIAEFGCSDCSCDSHLFYFKENPLHRQDFVENLLYYRMERLLE